ncbi:hypothetical protein FGB62_58g129 [Gracilaria domingensis]|nr:hypothetical protein FGB62_58g129 [Gracilaria domingensis]
MLVVAINEQRDRVASADKLISKTQDPLLKIPLRIIRISPWGGVTHALNLILHQVRLMAPDNQFILFQSPEVVPEHEALTGLLEIMLKYSNTLVVGHALKEHRLPSIAENSGVGTALAPLTGDVCPWNTMALWNTQMLARSGFPAVADEVNPPGMEEIGVITLQQMLYGPTKAMARIYYGPKSIDWITDFDDPVRKECHRRKITTKISRGIKIMRRLGLPESGLSAFVEVHYSEHLKPRFYVSDFGGQVSG